MRKHMIVGLGLLLGVSIAWAGDGETGGQGSATHSELPENPSPATASDPDELLTLMSARSWLQAAVDVSKELAGKDEEPETKEPGQAAAATDPAIVFPDGEEVLRFARESHVKQYLELRPWSWYYASWYEREGSAVVPKHLPQFFHASSLRELLQDGNAEIRAMAAESLATLHQPEDVPRLGRMLDDDVAASPFLGHTPLILWPQYSLGDRLYHYRSWRPETVAQCVQRALRLMTGQSFANEAAFQEWWKTNRDGRNCLWYWQERLERELIEADISTTRLLLYQRPDENWERYRARRQALNRAARAEVHSTITAELRHLAPEVEAKVRLLTVSKYAGGAPITGSEGQFWPDPPNLRVTSDRLLDLLDRKGLWLDVPWNDDQGRGMYNLLAERLGIWSDVLFTRTDVPRLRAALKREHDQLGWSGQAAMIIGISRLLPAARADYLDDPDTRDGALRLAVQEEPDLFVCDYSARELVRVGLPANGPFLKDIAFATRKDDQDNRIGQGILQALAQPPLTLQKRQFLVELLLDPRFEPFWTRQNTRMGMDMCRQYGIWAVTAHAGREVISDSIQNRLTDPAESDQALTELREIVSRLREESRGLSPSATMPDMQPAGPAPAVEGE